MFIYLYVYLYLYIYIYLCVCVCVDVYICVCMYVWKVPQSGPVRGRGPWSGYLVECGLVSGRGQLMHSAPY